MAKKQDTFSGPVLTVRLTDGLAATNRLPLESVLRILHEIKGMMEEAGSKLVRLDGEGRPIFALELMAGFRKGSVVANLAITRNPTVGEAAALEVIQTVKTIRLLSFPSVLSDPVDQKPRKVRKVKGSITVNPRLVRRLNNIAKVQDVLKTKLDIALRSNRRVTSRAVFDDLAAQGAAIYRKANLVIYGTTIHGKLSELRDRTGIDEPGPKKHLSGDLLCDNGEEWTIRFKASEREHVAPLWTKHVAVTGDAHYFNAAAPRLDAKIIVPDPSADYLRAFEEVAGSMPELDGKSVQELLDEVRGE